MALGPFTRIVLKRADGRVEVLTRPGLQDPNAAARALEMRSGGRVTAVRHEHPVNGTIAIHRMS